MGGITAFIYKDDYLNYQFGPGHPFKPIREKHTLDKLIELGIFDEKAKHLEPEPASEEDLLLVHSREYIDFVRGMSSMGKGYLDYGDTPATKGIYEASCSRAGGSIYGAKLIMEGEVAHAFNPGGGLHHAKRDSAAGFCVFNDVAIAARYLQRKFDVERIAIVDTDGHHGDGTQEVFYKEPVLTISLHRSGIYPGTGYVEELGEGEGRGYSVNVPLPRGTYDEAYLFAFDEVVVPLLRAYGPEVIIHQFGVDGHYRDPLVGLALTARAYSEMGARMHELAHSLCSGRYLILGGGGYDLPSVPRCWAAMFATVCQSLSKEVEELLEEEQPRRDERVFAKVKEIVSRVKETIFPFHGLK